MELHPLSGHGHDRSSRPVASLPGFADRSVLESRVDAASGAGRPVGAERCGQIVDPDQIGAADVMHPVAADEAGVGGFGGIGGRGDAGAFGRRESIGNQVEGHRRAGGWTACLWGRRAALSCEITTRTPDCDGFGCGPVARPQTVRARARCRAEGS